MREPFKSPQGFSWTGVKLASEEALRRAIDKAAEAGLRIQVQCSGSAAIDSVLEIFDAHHRRSPLPPKRWTIEHCQFPSRANIEVCKRMGIVATSAVSFLWDYGHTYRQCFGALADEAVPYRAWLDGGVMLANSSDGHPFEPLFGFWQMLARQDGYSGQTLGGGQRISRQQALRACTYNGAYAAFWEEQIGSIEPGKLADLVVLSQDIMSVPEERIRSTRVLATLVGGRPVHDSGLFARI
jgi:predicted amidohydrolase YtcJ